MGVLSRWWGYLKTLVTGGVEKRMRPEVQIEQAMADARKQDLELRNQAARVIAHRTELQMKLDRAIDDAAEARAQAGQALKNADSAHHGRRRRRGRQVEPHGAGAGDEARVVRDARRAA